MSDCIEFQGCKQKPNSRTSGGYGLKWDPKTKRLRGAHVLAWEETNGPVPKGMNVCHSCDNRACINQEHLFLGTHKQNMEDMVAKERQAKGSKVYGSKLTEETAVYAMARLLTGRENQVQIAEAFGVTGPAINLLWKGKRWAHVFE